MDDANFLYCREAIFSVAIVKVKSKVTNRTGKFTENFSKVSLYVICVMTIFRVIEILAHLFLANKFSSIYNFQIEIFFFASRK